MRLFDCPNSAELKTVIIRTDAEFKTFRKSLDDCSKNSEVGYAPVDFEKFSLLGQYAEGSCHTTYEPQVLRDDSKKTIKLIIVKHSPTCLSGPPTRSLNLVKVARVPIDYIFSTAVNGEAYSKGHVELLKGNGPMAAQETKNAGKSPFPLIVNSRGQVFKGHAALNNSMTIELYKEFALFDVPKSLTVKVKDIAPTSFGFKPKTEYKLKYIIGHFVEFKSVRKYLGQFRDKNGKGYTQLPVFENEFLVLENDKKELKPLPLDWVSTESLESYWKASREKSPRNPKELAGFYPLISRPPQLFKTPIKMGYMAFRLKNPKQIKIYPIFPNKEIFTLTKNYEIRWVFVKVTTGFASVGRIAVKAIDDRTYNVDRAAEHFVLLPTNKNEMALLDIRWFSDGSIIDEINYDPSPEQDDQLKEFVTHYDQRRAFGHP